MTDPKTTGQDAPGGAAKSSTKRIGRILIEDGAITQEDLDKALAVQAQKGGFIGQILLELGLVKQETIVSSLVKQCKIPHLSLLDYEISKDVLQLIPKEICLEHGLLPIDKLGRILTVAMINPLDVEALEEIRALCPDLRIKPILCDYQHFMTVTNRLFGTPVSSSSEVDMKSFGLGPAKPKAEPPPFPQGAPAPAKPAAPSASNDAVDAALMAAVSEVIKEAGTSASSAGKPAAPAASRSASMPSQSPAPQGIDPKELASLVRDGVSEAMREAFEHMKPAAGPSAQELAAALRESLGGVMQQAVSALAGQMQPASAPAPAPPSAQDMAAAIRDSLGAMIQQSFGELASQIQAANRPAPAGPSAQEFGEILKTAVRDALIETEETAATAGKGAKAGAGKKGKGAAGRTTSVSRKQALQVLDSETEAEGDDEEDADELVAAAMSTEQPIADFTFEKFLVGSKNQFTAKVCETVAAKPGTAYNPLFLYGGVGLGKTHLINAIGNAIVAADDSQRIGCVSASHFVTRLADAMRDHTIDAFREEYSHWDVLILDDAQLLGGHPEAQEEFFHVFNALQQQGRQIIIAADQSPDRLGLIEQRLISRFSAGMVASLKPPDWDTRLAILRQHVPKKTPAVNDETLGLIATRVPNDVRKMIGALQKVIAYAELMKVGVSCEMANDVLSHLGNEEAA